jgi:HPt (histidine-containing phosphotransfer) domain-containing protein
MARRDPAQPARTAAKMGTRPVRNDIERSRHMLLRRAAIRSAIVQRPAEACPSRNRPIDLVHLARQTLGDRELEREVLGLMLKQIEQCSARIELAVDGERRSIAHALKGAARNVGAFPLGERAGAVEDRPVDEAALAALQAELRRTADFVRTLLGS